METAQWALLVSLGSLAISGLTFWRNRWSKPEFTISWDYGDRSEDLYTDSVRCVARNRGRGETLDVRLEAVRGDGTTWPYAVGEADVVSFGQEVELWFNFSHQPPHGFDEVALGNQYGGSRSVQGVPQEGASRTVKVRLTWHQAPRTSKTRTKDVAHTDVR